MDLLLKNNMYDEVIQIFDIIKNKQIKGTRYPKNAVVLVFAACYKLVSLIYNPVSFIIKLTPPKKKKKRSSLSDFVGEFTQSVYRRLSIKNY